MRRPIKTDVDVAENNNNGNVVDLKKLKIKKNMRVERGQFFKGSHTHAHTYQCGGECKGVSKKIKEGKKRGVRKHRT